MLDRQKITTFGITTTAAAAVLLAVWLKPWKTTDITATQPEPTISDRHQVDVVFAIDTTSSMGDLIDSARRTAWRIATHIKQVDPQADLHVGLIAYRDTDDFKDYVTKDFALTDDMDAVYAELASYQAAAGGDVPEDVDAALYDGVYKMKWRDGATKMMFLVGDAPPATRGEVQPYNVSAHEAGVRGIRINTIRCGHDPDTERTWKQIAALASGSYASIDEDGGLSPVIATPYDAKMAALSATIDGTVVIYGDGRVHAEYRAKMDAKPTAAPAAADRAAYYATEGAATGGGAHGKGASRGDGDVIGAFQAGSLDVDGLEPDKLPADLAAMSKPELQVELARRADARVAAQKELGELAKQRDAYLAEQAKTASPRGGFDQAVDKAVDAELK
jgi:hypothetical protein|nr:vWA domain-containing protein [Kofleriaceae bacterium]